MPFSFAEEQICIFLFNMCHNVAYHIYIDSFFGNIFNIKYAKRR